MSWISNQLSYADEIFGFKKSDQREDALKIWVYKTGDRFYLEKF